MMMRALLLTLLFSLQLAHAATPQPPRKTADSPVEWLDVGVVQSYIYKERLCMSTTREAILFTDAMFWLAEGLRPCPDVLVIVI